MADPCRIPDPIDPWEEGVLGAREKIDEILVSRLAKVGTPVDEQDHGYLHAVQTVARALAASRADPLPQPDADATDWERFEAGVTAAVSQAHFALSVHANQPRPANNRGIGMDTAYDEMRRLMHTVAETLRVERHDCHECALKAWDELRADPDEFYCYVCGHELTRAEMGLPPARTIDFGSIFV